MERPYMTPEEYKLLYEKYISGECTSEEQKLLENYQDSFEYGREDWDPAVHGDADLIRQSILDDLNSSIDGQRKKRFFGKRFWYAAASVALVLFAAYFYLPADKVQQLAALPQVPRFYNDIRPGTNTAVLVLGDGSRINLNEAGTGLIAKENNTAITKSGTGHLLYTAGVVEGNRIKYNSVITPRGGQFRITLPDGSRVWLNAGSSLRFPTVFTGMERRVDLTGEAYFEVAKNTMMPFKVYANNSEIRVLGTHFNVMAYDDESQMSTTLLEGSVQVRKGNESLLIKPGEAAVLDKGTGSMDITAADSEQAVAWKNGYFIFLNENIESIMRKVSRWYNVEVTYKGNMVNKDFAGTISRDKNVSELLHMLELTGAVHFKIEGRRITVMP